MSILTTAAGEPGWDVGAGFRSRPLSVVSEGKPGFTRLPPTRTGVGFTNHLADRTIATNRVLENGSGVALGDVDGDGRCDIYFCRMEGDNVLYRNLGDWRFEDVTAAAGVGCPGQHSTGTALADVDGDGDLDLLVNAISGGTRLFLNDGKARFAEVTGSRLVRRFGATSMALADIDGDGDLDLYVTNYRTDTYRDRPPGLKVEARTEGGRVVITPEGRFVPVSPREGAMEVRELGERDFLYLNDGGGRFLPVSWTAGSFLDEDGRPLAAPPLDWGLSVMFRDLNRDGAPDIYVCNDFFESRDRVWMNQGGRGFRAAPRGAWRAMSVSSMAVDVADVDRDGLDDVLVVDMLARRMADRHRQRPEMMQGRVRLPLDDPDFRPESPRNTLFLNRGDGTYAEIAQFSRLEATEWSWGVVFLDVDLDGYEDVLIANGNHHDVQDADVLREIDLVRDRETPETRLARFPRLHVPNLAFRNRGDSTFDEVGATWGFDLPGVSQGMALADLDGDGDQDVVLNNLNAVAALLRNDAPGPRIAVRLRGLPPNTRGIGARIEVFGGPVRVQGQEMICGGRYESSDEPLRVFAASGKGPFRIEVTWRSGRRSVVSAAEPDRLYEVDESGAGPATSTAPSPVSPLFEDRSAVLNHVHVDPPFDDLARQPLLSRIWSRLGPGVAWLPSEGAGDGRETLVIGTGAGGRVAAFVPNGPAGFRRVESAPVSMDTLGFVADVVSEPPVGVLAALSNYEMGPAEPSVVRRFVPGEGRPGVDLEVGLPVGAGPLVLGDLDRDGDLDLFLGGRIAAGRYPEPAPSRLYTNHLGRFVLDARRSAALARAGLVSGAVFADLNGDGWDELVLACHWGPVRVFENETNSLREVTRGLGLGERHGWWNGVTTGDFDGDGRLDLVVSNWGRNSPYERFRSQTVRGYHRDFDGDGVVEWIEAVTDPLAGRVVPRTGFEAATRAFPFLAGVFPTRRAFGEADLGAWLAAAAGDERVEEVRVDTTESGIFLNRGGTFEFRALPREAQLAPAFGATVADFDGDGAEDLFLAQNFFGITGEDSRFDAGNGLLLFGNGRGEFEAAGTVRSGIGIAGEQRGCATADYDRDGRPDLVVAQNHGVTRLFRNVGGRAGMRVRLRGSKENRFAVGAIVRLVFGGRKGPVREVHAGSGYGSQDSLVPLLGMPRPATEVEVSWPGGRVHRVRIPEGASEVDVILAGAATGVLE